MARSQASRRTLAVARGDEPADTLIVGGRVLSDATREWIDTSLAIADGTIAGWGERDALEVVDVDGAALTPGFVDAHMHLESTKLWVDEFVRTVLPVGTTAVAADPHELANVLGVAGILALMEAVAPLPFTFGVYAPSCVPASPFECSGATLDARDIRELIKRHGALGVGEVMNFPGVIAGEEEMLARIAAAGSLPVDGHSPGLSGRRLDAYLAAGVESDHESTRLQEAAEKRRKGMWVFLRQGSASQNLVALAPGIVLHRRPGTRHAAPARSRQRLRSPGGGRRHLGDRRDPAGQHESRALSRHAPAGQPRARPPGRHPGVLLAARLGSGAGVAGRPPRRRGRSARARGGAGVAGAPADA
jgi:adenine deaminase